MSDLRSYFPREDIIPGSLAEYEVVWRERQPWLEEQGYRLRPRYHKNWVPSWGDPSNFNLSAEDAINQQVSNLPPLGISRFDEHPHSCSTPIC